MLETEDGAFHEPLQVQLRGLPGAAVASADVSPEKLRGTYDASFFDAKEPVISIRVRFGRGRGDAGTATSGYAILGDNKPSARGEQQASALIIEW